MSQENETKETQEKETPQVKEDVGLKNMNGVYGFVENESSEKPSLYPGRPMKSVKREISASDKIDPLLQEEDERISKDIEQGQSLELVDPKDIAPSQEKLTSKAVRNIQGMDSNSPPLSPPPDSPTEKLSQKGSAPLSLETKMELNRIKNLPMEQRKDEMAKFFEGQKDIFGNLSDDGTFLQLDTTILPNGKGVLVRDESGEEYRIDYE